MCLLYNIVPIFIVYNVANILAFFGVTICTLITNSYIIITSGVIAKRSKYLPRASESQFIIPDHIYHLRKSHKSQSRNINDNFIC